MPARSHSGSVEIERDPQEVYALVSDVTRMGSYSPICKACWWDDEPPGPRVGAVFTGRNETPERTWETKSRVVAADPGREFAFTVGDGWVVWTYRMEPLGPGRTRLTERWDFTEKGIAGFHERYGPDAPAQIEDRTRAAHTGIPVTLAAIKQAAQAS